ncbi:NAD-P-binding protein [Gautieria morchelliformis]|nr:NAD-P-binding protein [Gautieria morchelliformis]
MYTWLVTGTSRGMGLELARQIVAGGDMVFATARSPSAAPALHKLASDSPPGHVHIIQLDAAVRSVDALLLNRGLDYLVNNAARSGMDFPSTMDPTTFLDTMKANVVGPALVFQAFLPALERSTRPEGPVVLNTSSSLGSIGIDYGAKVTSYSISKTALNMLTYKQSKEKPNIIFFVMDPGWVKTDMGGEGAELEIPFTVEQQYKQITGATRKDSGTFKRYNGEILPW